MQTRLRFPLLMSDTPRQANTSLAASQAFLSPASGGVRGFNATHEAMVVSGGRLPLSLACLLGAAGMFFGQPNNWLHFPPLVLLYPFCLFLLALSGKNTRCSLRRCFLLGLAANSASLYWLVHPMHDVAALPYPAAAACVVLLSCYLALFAAFAGLGARGLARLIFSYVKTGIAGFGMLVLTALLSGLVYGGFEVLTGWLFTGFPWLSLSSAFAFTPAWVQTASLIGSYGLSAIYAAAACLAALALLTPSRAQGATALLLAAALIAAQPVYGAKRLKENAPAASGPEASFVMVQGNIDQNQKWEPRFQKGALDLYLRLSREGIAAYRRESGDEVGPAVVLWPETALPFYFQLHKDYAAEVYDFARENKVNMIFGSLGIGDDGHGSSALFNRLYLVSPQGKLVGRYDKKHLVPFGEYMPFAADIAFLRKLLQGVDFSPGRENKPFLLDFALPAGYSDAAAPERVSSGEPPFTRGTESRSQPLSLGGLICYEAIFPYLAQQQVDEGASILVNVSNDAWFRRSSAPLQHLSLTAMRAVEQARPIVRCTNTGISAVVDSRGRIKTYSDSLFEAGAFIARVAPSAEETLFHRLFPLQEHFLVIMAVLSLLSYLLPNPRRVSRDLHVSVK